MTYRVHLSVLTALSALSACAKMAPPAGGPPDPKPPVIIATRPDSLTIDSSFGGYVQFRFDEVVSEGSQPNQGLGTGDLEKAIILSPTTEFPIVKWHRTRIDVRPREGWQAERVYRVELLPNILDLRGNRIKQGRVLTFTTGAPLPTETLIGIVTDWTTGKPVQNALIEAILLPDSLPYRGVADSSGYFSFGPLPRGEYLVYGAVDQNRNLKVDRRELFDTVRVAADSRAPLELWAFPRDTAGPRIKDVTPLDSLHATINLTQFLDPSQALDTTMVSLRALPDSTAVPVVALTPKPLYDSLAASARAAAMKAAADTSKAAKPPPKPGAQPAQPPTGPRTPPPPKPKLVPKARPTLYDKLVITVATPFKPDGRYELELANVRNVSGAASSPKAVLAIPEAKKAPADTSKKAAADSTTVKPDSLGKAPGDSAVKARADSAAKPAAPPPTTPDSTKPPGRR